MPRPPARSLVVSSLVGTAFAAPLASDVLAQSTPLHAKPSHEGLVYATLGTRDLALDLYLPTSGSAPHPVLVHIHGGAWSEGERAPLTNFGEAALTAGFAVASIDYRLTSQASEFAPASVVFPAQIHDVKGAVRWLRANAPLYELDEARFAAWGGSSGGHLAALLATSGGSLELEGDVGGNAAFSSRVQVAIDWFGPTDLFTLQSDVRTPPGSTVVDPFDPASFESALLGWNGPGQGLGDIVAHLGDPTPPYPELELRARHASPIHWIDAGDPPIFVAHGTHDTQMPVRQSVRFALALQSVGVQCVLRTVPNIGHGLGGAIEADALAFALAHLAGTPVARVGTSFCAGDGLGTACPCANETDVGAHSGCAHAAFVGGSLQAFGSASIANDTLWLAGTNMLNSSALYFQGTQPLAAGAGVTFGDGLRCVGGAVMRLGTRVNQQGASRYPEANDAAISVRGGAQVGSTHYYQAWFRDPTPFCSSSQYNLTNALELTWQP